MSPGALRTLSNVRYGGWIFPEQCALSFWQYIRRIRVSQETKAYMQRILDHAAEHYVFLGPSA